MHQSGKMQLLLGSLLLASHCTISSWSASSDKLMVTQTPDVSVMEGESVSIICCWTGSFDKVRLEWKKKEKILNTKTFLKNDCLTWTFPKIKREDSGRYVCKAQVEIPQLISEKENGTTINVTTRNTTKGEIKKKEDSESPSSPLNLVLVVPLVVLGSLLLLITLICLCRRWRNQERALRVIYEVPHIDSDVDKHSTSSSVGSSQWCQVPNPVYMSFDYFEGVTNEDSK